MLRFLLFALLLCSAHLSAQTTPAPTARTIAGLPPHLLQKAILYHQKYNFNFPNDTLTDTEIAALQEGDILLRSGVGGVSMLILDLLNEPYRLSHAGFLFRDTLTQEWRVIHALPDEIAGGISTESLLDFARNAQQGSLVAVRVQRATPRDCQRFISNAHFFMQRKTPFDFSFDSDDHSRFYCSELVQHILFKVFQTDLMPTRIRADAFTVVAMSNFFNNEHFQLLFSHLPLHQCGDIAPNKKEVVED